MDAVEKIIDTAHRLNARTVIEAELSTASVRDIEFLRVMAQDDGPAAIGDIGRRMGAKSKQVADCRARLIAARLRAATTERLSAHDLAGVMDHGAPETEYSPEMEDFARVIAAGGTITPEVVATVWHKWFGDPAEEPAGPTPGMAALAADLQAIQSGVAGN